jgi:predicted RNase H-like nuclease
MTWVAGADGFKRGWRVVLCEIESDTWTMRDVAAFSELLELREAPAIVCVDMPIGLHEHTPPGGESASAWRADCSGRAAQAYSRPLGGRPWHVLIAQTLMRRVLLAEESA